MEEKKYDALEQALSEISAGQDVSDLIAANPELGAEIEAAGWANMLSETQIPEGAAHRSRTRVLARAMQLRPEVQPRRGIFQRIPRLVYALVLVLILLVSWNGLVIASAQSLPGDQLYPAKLTLERLRLGLALSPQTHQEVEEEYQARRIDEVRRLLALKRVEFVEFFGVVEEQWDDFWIIEGIEVRLLPETIILGDILPGMTVEVEGATQPEGWVQASEIHLQNYSFDGAVESISNTAWIISGQEVLIASDSIIDPDIEVGDFVLVEVTSDDFGILTVKSITKLTIENRGLFATETPTPSKNSPAKLLEPTETEHLVETDVPDETEESDESDETDETDETEEPKETEKPEETDEADETDEPDEPDETDETDETDQTEEPKETKKPEETDEADETDEPDEPDETNEPDETDEPDETEEP